jgi:hypothetical protein
MKNMEDGSLVYGKIVSEVKKKRRLKGLSLIDDTEKIRLLFTVSITEHTSKQIKMKVNYDNPN